MKPTGRSCDVLWRLITWKLSHWHMYNMTSKEFIILLFLLLWQWFWLAEKSGTADKFSSPRLQINMKRWVLIFLFLLHPYPFLPHTGLTICRAGRVDSVSSPKSSESWKAAVEVIHSHECPWELYIFIRMKQAALQLHVTLYRIGPFHMCAHWHDMCKIGWY